MLYRLAHILRNRFCLLWNLVEWGNGILFAMTHRKGLSLIPEILQKYSAKYNIKMVGKNDVSALANFFAEQPEEVFKFFKPHKFDEKSLKKIIRNQAFLAFLVMDGDVFVGYFFLRCFVNGKCFKGYMVDYRQRGKGLAKLEGLVMNEVNSVLNLHMFGSISPDNPASMAVAKSVNEIKILSTLENGDYYIEFLPKEST